MNATAADLKALLESAVPVEFPDPPSNDSTHALPEGAGPEESGNGDGRAGDSQATRLVALAIKRGVILFHDAMKEAYVTFKTDNHYETWNLSCSAFKQWIGHGYYLEAGRAPSAGALTDAINTLWGMAVFDGPQCDVHVRVGGDKSNIYVDLGDSEWRMVHITATGWTIKPHGAIKFRRVGGQLAMPDPTKTSERLDTLLRRHINVSKQDDIVLIIGFLLVALRPDGPKLLLMVVGEQGSGKSTMCAMIACLSDPNLASRRALPKDEVDAMIAAKNNHLLYFDNLSKISGWLADLLCRVITGGAISMRRLYSNDEEVIICVKRSILMSSIAEPSAQDDLNDRGNILTMPTILEKDRRSEKDIWAEFEEDTPKILGALFDAASCAIRNLPSTTLPTLERMADAILWVTAAEESLDWPPGTYAEAYAANRQVGNQVALESSLVYEPLCELVAGQAVGVPLLDSPGAILERISGIVGEKKVKARGWPGSPRGLRAALQRLTPSLRRVGIDITFPARTAQARLISVVKTEKFDRMRSGDAES